MLTYIVQRPFEVDGRMLRPGEPVAAEEWRNLTALLNQRYLRLALPETADDPTPRARGRKVNADAD